MNEQNERGLGGDIIEQLAARLEHAREQLELLAQRVAALKQQNPAPQEAPPTRER